MPFHLSELSSTAWKSHRPVEELMVCSVLTRIIQNVNMGKVKLGMLEGFLGNLIIWEHLCPYVSSCYCGNSTWTKSPKIGLCLVSSSLARKWCSCVNAVVFLPECTGFWHWYISHTKCRASDGLKKQFSINTEKLSSVH